MPNDPVVPARLVPLDRNALDRVLARAAELHAGHSERSEGMTEAQLIALGQEVGIAPHHIRQALAEERTRVTVTGEGAGVTDGVFGAAMVSASRVVSGTAAALLTRLDEWMQHEELLRQRRRFPDRITWERRTDLAVELKTGFNFSGKAYALRGAREVGATVVPIDETSCLVRLDADLSEARRTAMWVGGGAAALGTTLAATLVAWTVSVPGSSVLIAGLAGGGSTLAGFGVGAIAARLQRRKVERAQYALELALDRLELGGVRRTGGPLVNLLSSLSGLNP